MKRYINIVMWAFLAVAIVSCSKENPFDNYDGGKTGTLLTSALDVSLQSEYGPRSLTNPEVRAAAPDVDEFTVAFFRQGDDTPVESFKYSAMPEIITLPIGNYTARAYYGSNPSAEWEAPYYEGQTTFEIMEDVITDEVEPIVCKFANIRVSVNFSADLLKAMDDDCQVSVKVGESGSLVFTKATTEKSGYFAYVAGSNTLAATFTGNVDGAPTSETKAYDDVQPGSHYAITFTLHDAGAEDPGSIDGDDMIEVDAKVTVDNMNASVDSGEKPIEDDLRPKEDNDQPQQPDQPSQPDDPAEGPVITAEAPISFDKENEITSAGPKVTLKIHSDAQGGIREFKVHIDSNILTKEVLESVELSDDLDLVHPGSMESMLKNDLEFPVGSDVEGQSDVTFDITAFIPLLVDVAQGVPGHHEFILTVTDANGTTVKKLILVNK